MIQTKLRRLLSLALLFALVASMASFPSVKGAASSTQISFTHLTFIGTTTLTDQAPSDGSVPDNGTTVEISAGTNTVNKQIPHSGISAARVPATNVPMPDGVAPVSGNPGFFGFNGVSHRDQRRAGTGPYTNTQFSLEPPDQGLCVGTSSGTTFVLEAVNDALRVFTATGSPLTTTEPINQFFNVAPEIIRPSGPFGPFATDPRCYFDSAAGRFFLTVAELDVVPSTGAFTGTSHILLAVSQTSNPTGTWNLISLDVTDDGTNGTPSHPNCPCFGDQPLIGADANGFYISTNEFPVFVSGFNGAQIYAMSKTALAGGVLPTVVQINTATIPTPDVGSIPWFSVQPATTPPGGVFQPDTEFFLSSLDFTFTLDNRIAMWDLKGTSTLSSGSPSVSLTFTVLNTEVYGQPPAAQQRNGTLFLGQFFIPQVLGGQTEKLELIAGNDIRMQQVVFANGNLWSAINTVVKPKDGPTRVGIAFFIVAPSVSSSGKLGGSVVKQGYVAINQTSTDNAMFPSIGVNSAGRGIMTFTLVGPEFFPSAAYAPMDAVNGVGDVHIAASGTAPEDGFTGYHFFGSPDRVARWGDYSAAVAAPDGSIWMGAEYIPNAPRTVLANWGTFISNVIP